MMTRTKAQVIGALLVCSIAAGSRLLPNAYAQQADTDAAPVLRDNRSLTVEHDQVRTSADHHYNSPAERANDDLLITEVKSTLSQRGISEGYPVAVDCDHGTIELSGVVASSDDARRAETIALNTRGVVGVKNKLTWR